MFLSFLKGDRLMIITDNPKVQELIGHYFDCTDQRAYYLFPEGWEYVKHDPYDYYKVMKGLHVKIPCRCNMNQNHYNHTAGFIINVCRDNKFKIYRYFPRDFKWEMVFYGEMYEDTVELISKSLGVENVNNV